MLQIIQTKDYHGYVCKEFELDGRVGKIVSPKKEVLDGPYIWRTEFFGAYDAVDIEMLRLGWHLVYYQVSDMYGSPESIRLMHQFQQMVEEELHLAKKAVLFGFSRGGLYAVNYAAAYPEKVRALYLDAPVLDIFSWPGGFGKGVGAPAEWEQCKKIYGITDNDRKTFRDNPLDKADTLLEHHIPIVLVAGDQDETVPFDENGKLLYAEYMCRDGVIHCIIKKGVGHHPHSLEVPDEIVDAVLQRQAGVIVEGGVCDWQIVQQSEGMAEVNLFGYWIDEERYSEPQVFARVVREDNGMEVVNWQACGMEGQRWSVCLHIPAGGLYRIETCLDQGKVCGDWATRGDMIHHVGVGDVYVIAGQSNAAGYGKDRITDAPEPGVHLLKNSGNWDLASHPMGDSTRSVHTQNMDHANTGASPYLSFAKYLKAVLGYPIGLIQASLGGSPLSAWNPQADGTLYRSMMKSIGSQKIKGMLWYQGCSDTGEETAAVYETGFLKMVETLRRDLGEENLPVLTCQLNRCMEESSSEKDAAWGKVREIQRQIARREKGIYIVPTTDSVMSDPIHNSALSCLEIGERLARTALCHIYAREQVQSDAPDIRRVVQVGKNQVKLEFDNVYGEMVCFRDPSIPSPFRLENGGEELVPIHMQGAGNTIELTFNRELPEKCRIHGGAPQALCTEMPFDSVTHLPMLSFFDVPVE